MRQAHTPEQASAAIRKLVTYLKQLGGGAMSGERQTAEQIRALPLAAFYVMAESINDSSPVPRIFAAPEWDDLSTKGKEWVCALIRETMAVIAESHHWFEAIRSPNVCLRS
ncbi:MAG: hypothetical protein PGN25_08325 [Methylorubrum populi]